MATDIPVWVNCAVLPLFQADANWKAFTNYYARSQYTVEIYPAIDPSEGGISATVPDCDNKVTLTAEPAQLFSFKKWSDGSTENPRTITLTEDLQISAEFEKTGEYTMKYFRFCFSTPEGAVFSTDPSGWYAIEYDVAWEHPIYNIGITANEHFRIDFNMAPIPRDTKGNVVSTNAPSLMCTSDGDMENCTEATMAFDYADNSELMNANTDTIVIAIPVIGEQVRLSDVLTTNDKSMGGLYLYYDTDDYNYKLNAIEGTFGLYGDEVTVYAHPITGYDFTGWDDGSTDEIRTITLTDKVYTANFEPKQFLVTFTVSDNDYATISGQKTIEKGYAYGEQVALPKAEDVQVPEAVGSFDYWEVNGKSDVATEVIDGVTYLKDPR